MCTPNQCFQQNIKTVKMFPTKFSFLRLKKSPYIAHGQVFLMKKNSITIIIVSKSPNMMFYSHLHALNLDIPLFFFNEPKHRFELLTN